MTDQQNRVISISRMGDSAESHEIEIRSGERPSSSRVRQPGFARCDIVFVIDTTGSMSDKIQGLLNTCERFVERIAGKDIDWQLAIVAFGDLTIPGDSIVATAFSRKVDVIRRSLRNIPRYSGGANEGESSLEAIDRALKLDGYRRDSIAVHILMTDEPALNLEFSPNQITNRLREAGVLTYVVSGREDYFQDMASRTGGQWLPISAQADFLSVLDRLSQRIGTTVSEVQLRAGGDVKTYLRLRDGCS